jgi:hypothetical protein
VLANIKEQIVRPPKWIIQTVTRAMKAMNLMQWDLGILWQEGMTRTAEIAMQPEYETADIKVSKELEDDRRGRLSVIHEVCHLQHTPLYMALDYILLLIEGDANRAMAEKMFKDADELVIQREAVAWTDVLDAAARSKTRHNIQETKGLQDEV